MKNCRTTSKNKIFKFEEQRSSLTLENIDQVLSTKIIVDGCEINDNDVKCDYLHLAKGMEMYIELKGQDILHAMKQIERTMKLLSSNYQKQAKISYKLFDTQSTQEIENFKWRFHNYPVNQLDGLHNDVPSFLIN